MTLILELELVAIMAVRAALKSVWFVLAAAVVVWIGVVAYDLYKTYKENGKIWL